MYKNFFKRFFDIIISFIGIVILLPLEIIISLMVLITNPGPIFFLQERVGKNKKNFKMIKFRTMKTSAPHDIPTHLLEKPDAYITFVGKFLRKTSLDELPQLLNILVGQMAIIGPRPALWNQFDLIAEREKYGANTVRPGLTGWAQINGRDELSIEEKAKLDGYYVKNISLIFDLKCFFKTILVAIKQDGIVEGKNEKKGEKE